MNFRSREADISALDQFRRTNCELQAHHREWAQVISGFAVVIAFIGLLLVYLGMLRGHAGLGVLVFAILVGFGLYRSSFPKRLRS